MNQTKSDQILWVDTLKGACILLVVLYHTVLPGFEGTMKYLSADGSPPKYGYSLIRYCRRCVCPPSSLSRDYWRPMAF